jgi:hypothetical protein
MPTTEADTINADLLTFLNEPNPATTRGASTDGRHEVDRSFAGKGKAAAQTPIQQGRFQ